MKSMVYKKAVYFIMSVMIGIMALVVFPVCYAEASGYDNSQEREIGSTVVVGGKAFVIMGNEEMAVVDSSMYETVGEEAADITDNRITEEAVYHGKVKNAVFYKDSSLEEYDFSGEASLHTIGEFAFARSGLKEISIPEGITKLEYGAFYHCGELAQIDIPDTVTEIEAYCFEKTLWMENWKQETGNPFLIVGDGILVGYKGNDSTVTIPVGVKKIAPSVFAGHEEIRSVVLADSLVEIGEDAFKGCKNLKQLSGGARLEKIEDRAFEECPIKEIRIPASVLEIGAGAFARSSGNKTAIVIFGGDKLPVLSFEDTTTRLNNYSYRRAPFEGIAYAAVSIREKDMEKALQGSILEPGGFGFSGILCIMEREANNVKNGVLRVFGNTGTDSYTKELVINGKQYVMEESTELWLDEKRKSASNVPAVVRGDVAEVLTPLSAVTVSVEGVEESCILSIEEASISDFTEEYQHLENWEEIAGGGCFRIDVTAENSGIPITKVGSNKMILTLPLINALHCEQGKAVLLAEDGTVKELVTSIDSVRNTECLKIELNQTGVIVCY